MRLRGFPAQGLVTPKIELPKGRPVKVEIGFGKGASLLATAQVEPGTFFLGVEAARAYCELVRSRASEAGLGNVLVVHGDGTKLIESLPPSSLQKLSVLFPDPWPKRRHAKRRLITPAFVALAASRLRPHGIFVFKTDAESYFRQTVSLLDVEPLLARALVTEKARRADRLAPPTAFERKYRASGRRVYAAAYVRRDRPTGTLPP